MTYPGAWTAAALAALTRTLAGADAVLDTAADWCAEAIAADGLVHTFGSGHSRIPVEELFPRYGSYPGFSPLVELSTTFHTQIVGSNGQRQAMFIERVPGLAEQVLLNFDLPAGDLLLCFSVGGESAFGVEMARGCRARGLRVIAVTSVHPANLLAHEADLVVDLATGGEDALVRLDGLDTPVGPVSSFLYVAIANELKVRTAARLVAAGRPPVVLTGARTVGAERSRALFDAAYADHARRACSRLATTPRVNP